MTEKNNADAGSNSVDKRNDNDKLHREAPKSLPKMPKGIDTRPTFVNPKGDLNKAKRLLAEIISGLEPPVFFSLGGRITRTKGYELEALGTMGIRSVLDECIYCAKLNDKGERVTIYPPSEIAQAISATPELFGVPELKYLTNVPTILPDGTITETTGYYPEHKAYYTGKFPCGGIPDNPTEEDVRAAVETIEDILCDFPFVDQDKAHIFALLLSLTGRLLIDGSIPPFMISAATAGTGKSKLTDLVSIITQGFVSGKATWPSNEDEMNKQLITHLASGSRYIIFDNVNNKLDSATFASFTTSQIYEGRYLGSNKRAKLDNFATVVLTANNPTMSQEVARRFITVDLIALGSCPEDRTGFKHPNLIQYVRDNQPKLLAATLTLWRYWHCKGKPLSKHQLGSFEAWSERIGGVLGLIGIPGFLANRERVRQRTDVESEECTDFVEAWFETYGTKLVTATQLYDLCIHEIKHANLAFMCSDEREEVLLPNVILRGRGQRSAVTSLGGFIKSKANSTFSLYTICTGEKRNNVSHYFLRENKS